MKTKMFNELRASVKQATAIERGELKRAKARALILSGRELTEATAKDEAEVQDAITTVRGRAARTEAKAIQRGEMKPARVFKVAGRSVNALTARTLKTSKAGGSVKRFGTKKELFADVGL